MNLLSNLSYTRFDDFYIKVERIKYGWMNFRIGMNDECITYAASYLSNPLNDLLNATVLIVKNKVTLSNYRKIDHLEKYTYVCHELEPKLVTWLFKYDGKHLTLVIWDDMPTSIDLFDWLIENGFDDDCFEIEMLEKMPDLTNKLAFAITDSPVPFVKALITTLKNLPGLERYDDDINGNWGFSYSTDNLNVLNEWLIANDNPLIAS